VTNDGRVALPTVISKARAQLRELTGRTTEAVTSVERGEDGWILSIEVVELLRIPDSTSILGSYEVRVDYEGNLIEYGRTARYHRNQAGEDDS
jgi:Gas vesicle synthesis protein GvpO